MLGAILAVALMTVDAVLPVPASLVMVASGALYGMVTGTLLALLGPWRLSVDRELCIGTGVCAGTAPTYFDLEAGTSRPKIELTPPDQELLDVARSCPMEAITVVETATGTVLAPED